MELPKRLKESQETVLLQINRNQDLIDIKKCLSSALAGIPLFLLDIITGYSESEESYNAHHSVRSLYDRIDPFQFMIHKGCAMDHIKLHFERLNMDINDAKYKTMVQILLLFDSVQLLPPDESHNEDKAYTPELCLVPLKEWTCCKGVFELDLFTYSGHDINDFIQIGTNTNGSDYGYFVFLNKQTLNIYSCVHICASICQMAPNFNSWILNGGYQSYWKELKVGCYNPRIYGYLNWIDFDRNKYLANVDLWQMAFEYIKKCDGYQGEAIELKWNCLEK
eukprot:15354_1